MSTTAATHQDVDGHGGGDLKRVLGLVLRRDPTPDGAFRAPSVLPVVGALCCAYLLGPWARLEADMVQYRIAAGLLGVGVVLWALTWMTNRGVRAKKTGFRDIDHMEDDVR